MERKCLKFCSKLSVVVSDGWTVSLPLMTETKCLINVQDKRSWDKQCCSYVGPLLTTTHSVLQNFKHILSISWKMFVIVMYWIHIYNTLGNVTQQFFIAAAAIHWVVL